MKKNKKMLLMIFLCGIFFKTFAQTTPVNDTIMIDASEHSYSYDQEKNMILSRQSSYLIKLAYPGVLNNKIYKGKCLNQIILPRKQQFRNINTVEDINLIGKYTIDPGIGSIISIKVNKGKARSMYQRLKEKGILDISFQ